MDNVSAHIEENPVVVLKMDKETAGKLMAIIGICNYNHFDDVWEALNRLELPIYGTDDLPVINCSYLRKT